VGHPLQKWLITLTDVDGNVEEVIDVNLQRARELVKRLEECTAISIISPVEISINNNMFSI